MPAEQTSRDRSRFSTLDAILLAPLAAPFVLPPLALLAWGAHHLGAGYVTALHGPATPASWWSWPGVRSVETAYAALGLPPASDFSFSNPMRLFDDLVVIDRAILALLVNGIIALIPLCLITVFISIAVRTYRCTRTRRRR